MLDQVEAPIARHPLFAVQIQVVRPKMERSEPAEPVLNSQFFYPA